MVATHLDDVHTLHFVLLHHHDTPKRLERPHNVRSEFRVVLSLLSAEKEWKMEGRDFSEERRGKSKGRERGEGGGAGGRSGERKGRRRKRKKRRKMRKRRRRKRRRERGSTCCTVCRTVP